MEVKYLTEHQVIFLNSHQISLYSPSEMKGVKDPYLLNRAINTPMQSAFGEDAYPTIYHKAAALFESLAKNHCFLNANKRTAFASLYMFMRMNGYRITAPPEEAEEFTVRVVAKKNPPIDFEEIVCWIEMYSIMIG